MERHSIGEAEAFAILRTHARQSNRKVVDVAEAVVTSYLLLPRDRGGGLAHQSRLSVWGRRGPRARDVAGQGTRERPSFSALPIVDPHFGFFR
jgi:hypothetical protein